MVANVVDVVPTDAPLLKLPVARDLWFPRLNPKIAGGAWIYAGGTHHSSFIYLITAEVVGIEFVLIDENTKWMI